MTERVRYVKLAEWSDDDQCFVGQCPGGVGPCCRGDDESQAYADVCRIVEEGLETLHLDGKSLPPPTAGKNVAEKIAGGL